MQTRPSGSGVGAGVFSGSHAPSAPGSSARTPRRTPPARVRDAVRPRRWRLGVPSGWLGRRLRATGAGAKSRDREQTKEGKRRTRQNTVVRLARGGVKRPVHGRERAPAEVLVEGRGAVEHAVDGLGVVDAPVSCAGPRSRRWRAGGYFSQLCRGDGVLVTRQCPRRRRIAAMAC